MRFASVVWGAAEGRRLWLLCVLAIAMVSPVGVLAVVNNVISGGAGYTVRGADVALFVLSAMGVVAGQLVGARMSVDAVETMLDGMRMRLVESLRRLEYSDFERIGGGRIYDALTRNTALISEAAMVVLPGYAALGSLVLGGLYTLMLSPVVFFTLAGIVGASAVLYTISQRSVRAALIEASQAETGFLRLLGHVIHGFKETRLHRPRGAALEHEHLSPASADYRDARAQAAARIHRGISISYGFFYVMLASIAFVLPPFVGDQEVIVQSIYVAIFLLSTVEIILRSIPLVARAEFALDDLESAERRVEAASAGVETGEAPAGFSELGVRAATFTYRDAQGAPVFSIGPVDLSVPAGQTLFVVGGNGSGKSTFLKLLCRLYPPDTGALELDGRPVGPAQAAAWRGLFSSVFTDFHLFDRLYGLEDRTPEEVNDLLADLGLGGKVRFVDGAFSTTELSTGQRKRLALAVALLERRPVLILDEVAADQDQEFRERLYREILPRLKREGRTLIVVSHDDRYHDGADRVIRFADGRIVEDRRLEGERA
ncbi:cyclic peptide export ABC transporter [Albimonas sp. CAU 1670]|uniref:cyclic peptide export ABC transporter n=1 Tax=Albimonas sp. CAU 1670 TaxID=3032599 RepID=UPI0023DC38E3|nr:cyclic peptide export ABC transporter [Albimonas sp. CAU 1670]MDF2234790.1 cyclic peptide export ABC transporter [Albimonas sp. CAU 1670]